MRSLLVFVVNRVVSILVMMLVLNAYLQMNGLGRGADLPAQFVTIEQNFRVLADAFK